MSQLPTRKIKILSVSPYPQQSNQTINNQLPYQQNTQYQGQYQYQKSKFDQKPPTPNVTQNPNPIKSSILQQQQIIQSGIQKQTAQRSISSYIGKSSIQNNGMRQYAIGELPAHLQLEDSPQKSQRVVQQQKQGVSNQIQTPLQNSNLNSYYEQFYKQNDQSKNVSKKQEYRYEVNNRQQIQTNKNNQNNSFKLIKAYNNKIDEQYQYRQINNNNVKKQFSDQQEQNIDLSESITSLASSIHYQCIKCQLTISNKIITLSCLHCYHQDCLLELLQQQLNQKKIIVTCFCNVKISGGTLRQQLNLSKDSKEIQSLYTSQLSLLIKTNQSQDFQQCKQCKFIWIQCGKKNYQQNCAQCKK